MNELPCDLVKNIYCILADEDRRNMFLLDRKINTLLRPLMRTCIADNTSAVVPLGRFEGIQIVKLILDSDQLCVFFGAWAFSTFVLSNANKSADVLLTPLAACKLLGSNGAIIPRHMTITGVHSVSFKLRNQEEAQQAVHLAHCCAHLEEASFKAVVPTPMAVQSFFHPLVTSLTIDRMYIKDIVAPALKVLCIKTLQHELDITMYPLEHLTVSAPYLRIKSPLQHMNLKCLDLWSGKHIGQVEIGYLPSLHTLHVSHMQINFTTAAQLFLATPRLKVLELSNCIIPVAPMDIYTSLTQLNSIAVFNFHGDNVSSHHMMEWQDVASVSDSRCEINGSALCLVILFE